MTRRRGRPAALHVAVNREGLRVPVAAARLAEALRLVLRAERDFEAPPVIEGALLCQVQGRTASLVLQDWTPDRLRQIEQQTAARVEVAPLTLEDIFLAVHA